MANSCRYCRRGAKWNSQTAYMPIWTGYWSSAAQLEHLLVKTHLEAEFAWKLGASEDQMKKALTDIRHAQWRWKLLLPQPATERLFITPVETLRIISSGMTKSPGSTIENCGHLSRDLVIKAPSPSPM
ncbi:MAG: ammonia-forming cytochrome c nitrite reductase subunit c552 [Cyclobacteriaceae bacterium]|nr:ammonia-forming cytochrome c nitrite reductase subunit c552 [Cyclobacteriaceae bacterium]